MNVKMNAKTGAGCCISALVMFVAFGACVGSVEDDPKPGPKPRVTSSVSGSPTAQTPKEPSKTPKPQETRASESEKPVDVPEEAPPAVETTSEAPPVAYYTNCDAVRDAGAAPLYRGQPGYRSGLDRDGDGKACDWS